MLESPYSQSVQTLFSNYLEKKLYSVMDNTEKKVDKSVSLRLLKGLISRDGNVE